MGTTSADVGTSQTVLWGYRFGSFLAVVALELTLSTTQVLMLFSVLGLGHAFVAWLYQARVGAMGKSDLIKLPLLGAAIYVVFGVLLAPQILIGVTAFYFAWHFLVDEKKLGGESPDRWCLLQILPVLLMYLAFILAQKPVWIEIQRGPFAGQLYMDQRSGDLRFSSSYLFLAGASILSLLISMGHHWKMRMKPLRSTLYFYAMGIGLLGLYASGMEVWLGHLIGGALLFHYFNWYCHYYFKFQNAPTRLKEYVAMVVGVNAIVIVLFIQTGYREGWPLGQGYLFHPIYFYMWTLLHLVDSHRPGEFKAWLSLPLSPPARKFASGPAHTASQ